MSKNILIFGDSITRGAFDLEKGGWANRLKMYFWRENKLQTGKYYQGIDVDIFAIDGDTTKNIIDRFEFQIKNYQWQIDSIIFAVGINDSAFVSGQQLVDSVTFEKNLQILIEKAKEVVSSKVICLGLTRVVDELASEDDWICKDSEVKKYDKIIQEVAEKNKLQFCPMHDLLTDDDLADGLHPNAEGHRKMFERVRDFLKKVL